MKNIRVAILDTGISGEIKDNRIKYGIQIYYDYICDKFVFNELISDYNGHGTACISTIWDVCPNVDIYVIKVLNISGQVGGDTFLEALKHVATLDVEIVSICASFKVDSIDSKVKEICDRMTRAGKIIVASVQNGKRTSSIANYDNVIGVIGGEMEDREFFYCKNREIQMQCSSYPIIIQGLRGMRKTFQGNSKATAIATGIIADMLYHKEGDSRSISDILTKKSTMDFREENTVMDISFKYKEYDRNRERFYAENDEKYLQFLYILCELFLCEDVEKMREVNLLEHNDRYILKRLEDFLELIEERFLVRINKLLIDDFQWAYIFYERYLK